MITPIKLGTFGADPKPLLCYLVQADEANVLVNTGVGTTNDEINQSHSPAVTDFAETLKTETGLDINQVDIVINTSLLPEHCGNNTLFHRPPVYIQSAEYDDAMSGSYTVMEWFNPMVVHYQQLNGDYQVTDHIRIVASPGYTIGHQSVLVDSDSGGELIVGHAIQNAEELEQLRAQPAPRRDVADEAQYLASAKRLLEFDINKAWFCHAADPWTA